VLRSSEISVAILIKCNASEIDESEEFSITATTAPSVRLAVGDEVYVWTSEKPRLPPNGRGLQDRGELLAPSGQLGRRKTVRIRVRARLTGPCFGMQELSQLAQGSQPARHLYNRIQSYRHRRIWGLSSEERQVLSERFSLTPP
jgi:hypothetical protein